MKAPPWWDASWRSWLYAVAWLGGGLAFVAIGVWEVSIIAHDPWPEGTEAQRLGILANALYLSHVTPLIVMLGLGLRNAIRNIKASAGAASFEASGHEGPAE